MDVDVSQEAALEELELVEAFRDRLNPILNLLHIIKFSVDVLLDEMVSIFILIPRSFSELEAFFLHISHGTTRILCKSLSQILNR